MKLINNLYNKFKQSLTDDINDELKRTIQIHRLTYILLGSVFLFMTIVNALTKEFVLMWATLFFSVFVIALYFIVSKTKYEKTVKIAEIIFGILILVLFSFFLFTGLPEGVSHIWVIMLPTVGILFFGFKLGTIFSSIMFLIMIALFWIPYFRDMAYPYAHSFYLRFPIAYIGFYFIGTALQVVTNAGFEKAKEGLKKFQRMSLYDELTGVRNRYGLKEVDKEFEYSSSKTVAVMIFDLDDFKKINDTYGHDYGDYVLRTFAQKLWNYTSYYGRVCRWGGEEFLTFLYNGDECFKFADEFRKEIAETVFNFNSIETHITVSVGLVKVKSALEHKMENMVKLADNCLYEAKNTGKNKVIINDLTENINKE